MNLLTGIVYSKVFAYLTLKYQIREVTFFSVSYGDLREPVRSE